MVLLIIPRLLRLILIAVIMEVGLNVAFANHNYIYMVLEI
jgi:hypothetical protein